MDVRFVNVDAWEGRVQVETNVSRDVLSFQVHWGQGQVKIVDPYHIVFFLNLYQFFYKLFVDILVGVPEVLVQLIEVVGVTALETMEQG